MYRRSAHRGAKGKISFAILLICMRGSHCGCTFSSFVRVHEVPSSLPAESFFWTNNLYSLVSPSLVFDRRNSFAGLALFCFKRISYDRLSPLPFLQHRIKGLSKNEPKSPFGCLDNPLTRWAYTKNASIKTPRPIQAI